MKLSAAPPDLVRSGAGAHKAWRQRCVLARASQRRAAARAPRHCGPREQQGMAAYGRATRPWLLLLLLLLALVRAESQSAVAPAASASPAVCGDGVVQHGESCEADGSGQYSAEGCDAQHCAAKPGWRCSSGGCDCANAAGTLALAADGCIAERCPYAPRCPGSGSGCSAGAEGTGCAFCAHGYARSRTQLCGPCPNGPWMLIAAAVGLLLLLLVIGPFLARLASPVVAAQLRILILYLQHTALVADANLSWPPAASAAFAPLRGLTRGADVASPECYFPGTWTYQKHIELLAASAAALAFVVALALGGYTLLQHRIALYDDASEAAHAARVAAVEVLGRRRNALRQFFSIYAQIAYVMLVSVLLDAWDCPHVGPGGAAVLRADPATACGTPSFVRFRTAATAALAVFAAAMPLGIAALLRLLRGKAMRASSLNRPAWMGLAYPATRAAWGGFYAMYRFDSWHELGPSETVALAVPTTASPCDGVGLLDEAARAASPPQQFRSSPGSARNSQPGSPGSLTSSAGEFSTVGGGSPSRNVVARLRRAQRSASRIAAPYFECVYYAQRLLLIATGRAFPTAAAAAAGQATVFAAGAALVAGLAPFQRLDVRLPLRFWVPLRLRWASSGDGGDAPGWRRGPFALGWVYDSHVMLFDALNATAVAANLVPMLTIVAAAAARGVASPAMVFFLLGLNALMLLVTIAIWASGVAAFREQMAEVNALRAACCAAAAAGRSAAVTTTEVLLPDSDLAASEELPLAPVAAPLRRRARRSSAASFDGDGASEAPAEGGDAEAGEGSNKAGGEAAAAASLPRPPSAPARATLRVSIPEWLAEFEATSPEGAASPASAHSRRGPPGRLSAALGLASPASRPRRSSAAPSGLPRGAALLGIAAASHDSDEEGPRVSSPSGRGGSVSDGHNAVVIEDDDDDAHAEAAPGLLSRLRTWVRTSDAAAAATLAGVHIGVDTEATLVAAGAKFSLLRARQQHSHALTLARAAEFATALALVRLHHRRSAAQRADGAGAKRLEAIEAEMRALERVFAEQGFEAALARRGCEHAERQHRAGDAPGVGARAALAAALLLLSVAVAALGALARHVVAINGRR